MNNLTWFSKIKLTAADFKIKGDEAGATLIEMMLIAGLIGILATGIAAISNNGFQNLRNIRIGNDLQSIENLVSTALKRPATPNELRLGERICRKSLSNLNKYNGLKITGITINGPNGEELLAPFRKNSYTAKVEISDAVIGPIPAIYPDSGANGKLTNFNVFITHLLIIGEKDVNDQSVGSKITRTRIPIAIVTYPNGDLYDCAVNPTDDKKTCLMLGGRFTEDPLLTPRCLMTKLPIADDWGAIPTASTFTLGDLFVQNVIGIGVKDEITRTRQLWKVQRGVALGGAANQGMAFGELENGNIGIAANLDGSRFYSLLTKEDKKNLYSQGYFSLDTYGDRAWYFDALKGTSGNSFDIGMGLNGSRKFFFSEGAMVSARLTEGLQYLNGTQMFPLGIDRGFIAHNSDNRKTLLGRSLDGASGFFFANDTNVFGSTKTLAGAYWTSNYPGGAMVFKAYGGSDLIFQVAQQQNNCSNCTAMVMKGLTGDIGIGTGFSRPEAKLHVSAGSAFSPALRVVGRTEFPGETRIIGNSYLNRSLEVRGTLRSNQTIYAASDENLKTDIEPITNALEHILKINGVYFRWKNEPPNSSPTIGLIAQNVERSFPEVVFDTEKGTKAVAYANLVAPLIEAIREHQIQINELKKKRDQLHLGVERLRAKLCEKKSQDIIVKRNCKKGGSL
ncbi:MAG: hypothetical protein RJB66_548 [Pseudomonadota bacterium]|jgi:hypothetical protein